MSVSLLSRYLLLQLIGFVYGYVEQSFWLTFLCCAGGMLLSMLLCVPDWPWFNRHPLAWQPAVLLPGSIDPATGQAVQDSNENCGTCVCGELVHGIKCSSHPDANKQTANTTGDSQQDSASAAVAAPQPAAVEIQAVKARSNKKGAGN